MIVGKGNIAKCLRDREGAIFFASGVSNSSTSNPDDFARERKLITKIWREADVNDTIFYFSSIRVQTDNPDHPYTRHKIRMEKHIQLLFDHYVILRIGNLIGDKNPNTFVNYLRSHPEAEIKDEYRYMIDPNMLNTLCQTLPLRKHIQLNAFSYMAKVKDIISK